MKIVAACLTASLAGCAMAAAQEVSGDAVRIGILTDMSGAVKDTGGPGSVYAAELAISDFGGTVLGKPIELVSANHQNKPDIASGIARTWFDQEGVDAVFDLPVSAAAQAVVELARERKKVTVVNGAVASELTGAWCSPYNVHWTEDAHALAGSATNAQVEVGNDSWFFVTSDIAFGHSVVRTASETVAARGGKVVGEVRFPFPNSDFSSYLLTAQGSAAKVIGLSSAGSDTINAIKQAREFRVTDSKELTAFVVFITDVHGLGLDTAKGISFASGFYWDQSDQSREFSKRFYEKMNAMPTKEQAGVYASVLHYLTSIKEANGDEGEAVAAKMRELPIDQFGRPGVIRKDGRAVYDLALFKVKAPEDSKYAWDYYDEVKVIAGADAFQDPATNGCYLNK